MKALFAIPLLAGLLLGTAMAQPVKKATPATATTEVQTASGRLAGTTLPSGIRSFKGVPFAAPPVGARRWQAPQPVQPWKGVRPATQFGPRAMQLPLVRRHEFPLQWRE